MNRLFVALITFMALLVACENRSAYGVDSVAAAQADAIERWVLNNHRPYSFVISIGSYGKPPMSVTRVYVLDSDVERTEHLSGREYRALTKFHQPLDDLHRAMAYTLMVTQEEIVREVIDDEVSLVVSAKFERKHGVPLRFSYNDFGFSDRSITWSISEFRFLD